jgi:SAM-dependent methyltransferase
MEKLHRINEVAWDKVAAKYEPDTEHDVVLLQSGRTSLLDHETRILGDLSKWCDRAVHLQCSHGLDTLSLWKLGAREVVGIDIRSAMLTLARRKAELLSAPAIWIHSDVLETSTELYETADLVYTGKGAIPWIMNLKRWAEVVTRLLKPGGMLYIFEGHPLNWLWEPDASEFQIREDGGDYFSSEPRVNRDFPGRAISPVERGRAQAWQAFERQWTLGDIVTSLAATGLKLEHLEEHTEHYWLQFPNIEKDVFRRLPHSFSLVMRRNAA